MMARGNIEAVYPLTPVQEGILFHTLYAPDSPLYFQQYSALIDGDLDVARFRDAWGVVIARHQALRSLLTWERRDRPLQIVRETVRPEWLVEDWRSAGEPAERLGAFLETDRGRGFDLSVAPLMRFALFRLDDHRHRFVWSHHHIVIDGWSMGIVLDEVFRSYAALVAGAEPDLPPPSPYGAYISWMRAHDRGDEERFWRDLLAGFTAATPLRIEEAALQSPWAERHAEVIVKIPAERTSSITDAARSNGLTLNTMLRGAWALLLRRYCGSDDIVFGAATAGRPPDMPGALDMVGMFINTLPVRIRVEGTAPVRDWLRRVQDGQLAAAAHETTPLAAIQGWSEVPKGEPLFTSLLVFENVPVPETPGLELRISDVRYLQRSNYPLALLVMPGDRLELIFLYDADRFDGAVIDRMAHQLAHVLGELAIALTQPVDAVELFPAAELEEMLVTWNDTAAASPADATMHQLIAAAAATAPDRVAVTDGEVAVTYRDLMARAGALAAALGDAGVSRGARVGVCMERSPAMVVAIVGVLSAGAAYVPMDPGQPAQRLRFILDDTSAAALVTAAGGGGSDDTEWRRPVVRVGPGGDVTGSFVAGPAGARLGAPPAPAAAAGPDDLAYVLFTSGSTGRPKGVAVSHRNLVGSTHARRHVYPGRVGAFLLVSPLIFDSSLAGLFWTLYDAGTIVLPRRRMEQDVGHLAGLVQRHGITHTLALPALYDLMLEHATPGQLDSLDVVMVAGEACTPAVVARHRSTLPGTLLANEYGPTEATVWCTVHILDGAAVTAGAGDAPRRVPIGRPIPNMQAYILDERLRPAPVGVPGELCIAGVGVSAGYLGHPELTAAQFVAHELPRVGGVRLYRTGDIARYLPDGTIDLLGRIDHQVKIRGQRIELSEIEMVLRDHPAVSDAAVVVSDGEAPNTQATVTLVAYAATTATGDELRRFLADRLPDVMVPGLVMALDELPRGATGKIDRASLPAPERIATAARAPRSDVEHTLAAIWADVLGMASVGVTDNFFELGGDSILSIRIIARAHEAGLTITPRQFFDTPTVAELAATLE